MLSVVGTYTSFQFMHGLRLFLNILNYVPYLFFLRAKSKICLVMSDIFVHLHSQIRNHLVTLDLFVSQCGKRKMTIMCHSIPNKKATQ